MWKREAWDASQGLAESVFYNRLLTARLELSKVEVSGVFDRHYPWTFPSEEDLWLWTPNARSFAICIANGGVPR